MELGKFKAREVPPTVLRLHPDLRDELIRAAEKNNRSLTKEVSARLEISLGANGPTLQTILAREEAARTAPGIAPSAPNTPHTTGPQGQAVHLSEHDMAMLRVFHAMPVEKQLALLSLFK